MSDFRRLTETCTCGARITVEPLLWQPGALTDVWYVWSKHVARRPTRNERNIAEAKRQVAEFRREHEPCRRAVRERRPAYVPGEIALHLTKRKRWF